MMERKSDAILAARNGNKLVAGIVARISGCQNQKEESLKDQEDHGRAVVRKLYQGEIDFRVVATKGKGERLDRPELVEVEEILRSAEFDIIVMEDVGRLVRGPAAHRLWGIGFDNGTRLISPNDFLDTASESWEEDLLDACKDHMRHNAHTSRRLKHKMMNRFEKSGAVTPCVIAGYVKPRHAKTYDDWVKDESAAQHIRGGWDILKKTFNGESVAEYLIGHGVSPGKYCKKKKWDGRMALRLYRNTLLKGMPRRGVKHTVKNHEFGRRQSVPNPLGPTFWHAPHLEIIAPSEFDALQVELTKRNDKYRRRRKERGVDCRFNVPRKRTRAFGQHARCWYCGRHYVWGGNGVTNNLMCSGAREWKCWNSVGIPGTLAADKVVQAITERLGLINGLDDQFRTMVLRARNGGAEGLAARWKKLQHDEVTFARDEVKVKEAILGCVPSDLLKGMLKDYEVRKTILAGERNYLQAIQEHAPDLPESVGDLQRLLKEEFARLTRDSMSFGDLIRRIVPEMRVFLVRLCDGGHLLPRAVVKVNLLGKFGDGQPVPELEKLLASDFTLDLFVPPERERIREEAVRLAEANLKQRDIASRLADRPTQTAVWKAIELQRRMSMLHLPNPYVFVDEPPSDYAKLRRHKNHKFHFEPLKDYTPPLVEPCFLGT